MSATIPVNVKYFAALRDITGKKDEVIEVPEGATVAIALERLVELHGPNFKDYTLKEDRALRDNLAVLVNGETVPRETLAHVRLKANDFLVILPPISGG